MTLTGGAAVVHIILLAGYIPLIIGSEAITVFALVIANRIGLGYTIKVISWIKCHGLERVIYSYILED